MALPEFPVAMGVVRSVESTAYETALYNQMDQAKKKTKIHTVDELIRSGNVFESKG